MKKKKDLTEECCQNCLREFELLSTLSLIPTHPEENCKLIWRYKLHLTSYLKPPMEDKATFLNIYKYYDDNPKK